MITFPYSKYSGCGNDFIFVDHRRPFFPFEKKECIQTLCDREKGIGADGIIFLENSDRHEGKMKIFNRDGSEAAMCGNALRCLLPFMVEKGLQSKQCSVEVASKVFSLEFIEGKVKASMTPPTDIKLNLSIQEEGKTWQAHFINTGVPHLVIFSPSVKDIPIEKLGPFFRFHPDFAPQGANVNFVEPLEGKSAFKIRTYERGVEAETQACGTGATAAAIIMALTKQLPPPFHAFPISGESLTIDFHLENGKISQLFQTGPVHKQFEGVVKLQNR